MFNFAENIFEEWQLWQKEKNEGRNITTWNWDNN